MKNRPSIITYTDGFAVAELEEFARRIEGLGYDFDASLKWWEDHGFQVLGNPWYEPLNVWDFATKTRDRGILGYMGTTWSGIASHIGRYPHLPAGWTLAA